MRLWLVRHAEPVVAQGVCYGQLDMPAHAQATAQAAVALCAHWQAMGVVPAWIETSPLQRCEQLALALCAKLPRSSTPDECPAELRPQSHMDLMEMHFGCWEGVPWADIPRHALDAWTVDFGNHAFGGVESANAVLQRVGGAVHRAKVRSPRDGDGVWVTHAGVIRAASLWLQGVRHLTTAAQWPAHAPDYGQWAVVDV